MNEESEASWAGRYDAIYRFVRRRTSSREEAEDITQDVFTAAIVALAQARLETEAPPLAWLYTVARRRLIDRLRRSAAGRRTSLDPELATEDQRGYGQPIVEALLDGLRQLDEAQRRVIILKLFEGRSFADIGSVVGASEEACRMRLSRGLAELRQRLERKGVTP